MFYVWMRAKNDANVKAATAAAERMCGNDGTLIDYLSLPLYIYIYLNLSGIGISSQKK